MTKEQESKIIADESVVELSATEKRDVDDHVAQRTPVIFEIVRRTGEEELNRPALSLFSSGITAGISMGTSVLTEAALKANLSDSPASTLIEKLGYPVGFIIVIMAHQQLFTENTLTAIVPLIANPSFGKLKATFRLSAIVLLANLIGTLLIAAFFFKSGIVSNTVMPSLISLSSHSVFRPFKELLTGGIGAGFLIASLVWILANADGGKFWLILLMTYLISLFDFSHIIAGSVEAFGLLIAGNASFQDLGNFFVPTLLGNILGGSGLFAILAYGQIHREVSSPRH